MKNFLVVAGMTLALCACTAQTVTNTATDIPSSAPAAKRLPMVWVAQLHTLTLQVESTGEVLFTTECTGVASRKMEGIEDSVASIQCGGHQYAVFILQGEELAIMRRTIDENGNFGQLEQINE